MFVIGNEDTFKSGSFPWITTGLVLVNVVVYTAQAFTGDRITMGYAMTPVEITKNKDLTKTEKLDIQLGFTQNPKKNDKKGAAPVRKGPSISVPVHHQPGPKPLWLTVLTSMFLHGDTSHLTGNMWFLIIFGRNVEGLIGSVRFLVYYLLAGMAGNVLHIYLYQDSIVPCLGASGAISGVMGMYVSVFPFKKISIWFSWLIGTMEFPAIGVASVWFLLQFVHGYFMLQMNISVGVAYWVHIGGFGAGIVLLWMTVLWEKITYQEPEHVDDAAAYTNDAFDHAVRKQGEPAAATLATSKYVQPR